VPEIIVPKIIEIGYPFFQVTIDNVRDVFFPDMVYIVFLYCHQSCYVANASFFLSRERVMRLVKNGPLFHCCRHSRPKPKMHIDSSHKQHCTSWRGEVLPYFTVSHYFTGAQQRKLVECYLKPFSSHFISIWAGVHFKNIFLHFVIVGLHVHLALQSIQPADNLLF